MKRSTWFSAASLFLALQASLATAQVSSDMRFVARLNEHASDKYSAIWGYTHPDGREYALLGVRTGTAIVDITNSPILKEVSFIPSTKTMWRELKTYKNYAYVVTDSADTGIEIIDLSGLPARAEKVATFSDLPQSHTLFIDQEAGILYTMGGSGESVVALSLEDPLNPVEISRFGTAYVHDAFFKNGKAYLSEITSRSFSVWDVSDIHSPKFLKRVTDRQAPSVSFHNGWLTEDGNYMVTTEETAGRTVKIWDMQDLNNIHMVSEWLPPNRLAHNVQIKGQYAYLSSYGGGVRVLNLQDPTHPVESAFWARTDGAERGFVSVWGVYPYFKSGKLIASDIEEGLVVTEFDGAREN
jgi:choice-of-anchor B domain-containing protein